MNQTILPPNRHACDLGGSASVPLGTLRRCGECGTWWFTHIGGSPWPGPEWTRVRRYHFRLRNRIGADQ